MSFYASPNKFKRWLERAAKAVLTKNQVRKELWEQMSDIMTLTPNPMYYRIPNRYYATIMSFFNIEGKADNISSDQLFSIINVILNLIRDLSDWEQDMKTRPASPVMKEKGEEEEEEEEEEELILHREPFTPPKTPIAPTTEPVKDK
jgi:hypothetical protein